MRQQINLYRRDIFEKRIPFSARDFALTLLLAMVALAGIGGTGEWHLRHLAAHLQQLQAEESAMQSRLAAIGAYAETASPLLAQEVVRLRAERDQRRALFAGIEKYPAAAAAGFSPYLIGLARQTVPGLWLKRIALSGEGERILLQGGAGRPEEVPRLVQQLAAEPAFAGIEFVRLQLERGEKDDRFIDFILTTRTGDE